MLDPYLEHYNSDAKTRGVITVLAKFVNPTHVKHYARHIMSYKISSFCEQILRIGENDASSSTKK